MYNYFHFNIVPQEAVKLLGAICLIPPDGHEKTLEAITIAAEMKGGERYVANQKLCSGCPKRTKVFIYYFSNHVTKTDAFSLNYGIKGFMKQEGSCSVIFGHCVIQIASEVRFDVKIELSDLNYPDIYEHT